MQELPRKSSFFTPALHAPSNEVVLNLQILEEEVRWLFIVGEDAADFGGGDKDVLGLLFRVESSHRSRIEKIEFLACAADEILEALPLQLAPDRAADHAAVPGHIDFRVVIHCERPSLL